LEQLHRFLGRWAKASWRVSPCRWRAGSSRCSCPHTGLRNAIRTSWVFSWSCHGFSSPTFSAAWTAVRRATIDCRRPDKWH